VVSLDDAVLARMERGGKRYEILVDPDLVDDWRKNPENVELGELLAIEDVFHNARDGERPTSEAIESTFGSQDLMVIAQTILEKGSIQLTTNQRKAIVDTKRQAIIHHVSSNAVDPKTKLPHPRQRIELALEESRYAVDPFKSVDSQIKDVLEILRPLIPLSFETCRLAFRITGKSYGAVSQVLREYKQKEEWLSNGDWACIIEIPAAMKADMIGMVAKRDSEVEVKEL
jgi:ribosome maturation protein SDO1